MKLFTVEAVNQRGTGHLEIGGRNCRDSIRIGDKLMVESKPVSVFLVTGIEVYRKMVDELFHGYVGTLYIERVSGDDPVLMDNLVSE